MKTLLGWSITAGLGAAFLAAPAVAQTPGETVLYAFQGGSDGENIASALVVGSGGVLYGTTRDGGGGDCVDYWSNAAVVGCGTVFELTPSGTPGGAWTETILYSFTGGSDGAFPLSLVASGENLYGTTSNGGEGASSGNGYGVLFELKPPKTTGGQWKETVLYYFCQQSGCADGATPGDGLVLSHGLLYGATAYGGTFGNGTVFSFSPKTSHSKATFTSLYSFKGGSDGAIPFYGVITAANALYGRTSAGGGSGCGGSGCGTVYELTPPALNQNAWTETLLYAFTGGSGGAAPTGRLNVLKGGVVLGVAGGGGADNAGAIYELTPPKTTGGVWTETVLTSFGEGSLYGIPDGTHPNGGLVVGKNGSIYGTTYGGGDPNLQMGFFYPGTMFELTPPIEEGGPWVQSLLYSFQGGSDGLLPGWGLNAGPDGTLYGATSAGGGTGCPAQGNIGCGTVFQFTP
jgi:uncharacterized repeat protein (TIGR03803 family)